MTLSLQSDEIAQSQRSRNIIRSELENAEHEPSEKELSLLLGTLTPKEKDLLSAIGIGVILASSKTLKAFYQELKEKLK